MVAQDAHPCWDSLRSMGHINLLMVLKIGLEISIHGTGRPMYSILSSQLVLAFLIVIMPRPQTTVSSPTIQPQQTLSQWSSNGLRNTLNSKQMTSTSQESHTPAFMYHTSPTISISIIRMQQILTPLSQTSRALWLEMVWPTGHMTVHPLTLKWGTGIHCILRRYEIIWQLINAIMPWLNLMIITITLLSNARTYWINSIVSP